MINIIFQPIKEHRGKYYITYTPAYPGYYFAHLNLVFLKQIKTPEMKNLMEQECEVWIQRYSLPLMVTSFDDTDSIIRFNDIWNHLIGIPEKDKVVFHWKSLKDEDFPMGPLSESLLLNIYHDVPYSTDAERHEKAISNGKSIRLGLFIIAAWIVIPVLFVNLIGFASPLLGWTIIIYSIGKAILKALKMLGYIKKSDRESKKEAEELDKNHYYYHCEKNPEGFNRLKAENLERELQESVHKESDEIKDSGIKV